MTLRRRLLELAASDDLTAEAAVVALLRVALTNAADNPEGVSLRDIGAVTQGVARIKGDHNGDGAGDVLELVRYLREV